MYLPGVGPHKKELLSKELGVKSWGDLLAYFPYKYVDRSHIYPIRELTADMPFVQIRARILSYEEYEMGPRKKRVVGHASDGMGVVDLVWFSGAQYVYKNYKVGEEFIIFGKPTVYGGRIQIAHPDMDRVEDLQLSQMGLQPYYMYRQKYMRGNLENVGYALPGKECIYNIDMMEDTTSIMAHGAGAMTKCIYDAERRVERVPNPKDIAT